MKWKFDRNFSYSTHYCTFPQEFLSNLANGWGLVVGPTCLKVKHNCQQLLEKIFVHNYGYDLYLNMYIQPQKLPQITRSHLETVLNTGVFGLDSAAFVHRTSSSEESGRCHFGRLETPGVGQTFFLALPCALLLRSGKLEKRKQRCARRRRHQEPR